MGPHQQPGPDALEEAIAAFRGMSVPERPPDAGVLARLAGRPADAPRPSRLPIPSRRRIYMRILLSSAAAAMLLLGALALLRRNGPPTQPAPAAATAAPGQDRDLAVRPPPAGERPQRRESLGRRTLAQDVADAQVVVVATAVDWTPAPPNSPGDAPESLIRFQVKRVLKGDLTANAVVTRTPTAATEFIGKDWIILLSPDYLAGKHQFAAHVSVDQEPAVKAMLAKAGK